MTTQRYAIGVEFDGRFFRGWQTQQIGVPSVQATLEAAISRVANHPVIIHGAGRTDAGVHASGMIAHFDSDANRSERNWLMGVNSCLPESITLRWLTPIDDDFHARFHATARRYHYIIYNHPRRSSHLAGRATWHYHTLDLAPMQAAAQLLLGRHDFSAYRAVACQSNRPVRDVHFIDIEQRGPLIRLDIQADGFLHHMVRNIVGVMFAIGQGHAEPSWAADVLASKNRSMGGITAPPDGLYFVDAHYAQALPRDSLGPTWLSAWPCR
ncbi:tRNA pseudouridine38-40 synthase [Paraperlucidibaca baekdonensis]|uniref:tRNA pseudouridine synthase A n=1 Tax=Paraperlucidibaca baekdonensis TaxID=748120 RepID=A0A3E0H0T2_9GAMM|nr:tRNA pseudouridine(38-40) synthase TruA [Paraperlucidibaca baekdonensis]REH36663.1 tRNA pseudouridine38-40 synthase [Paraperlucidibaca baekdonensis]